ncbi:MAG: R3H domain-containing nucleic acid-binding protein [Myxococcota bacterium]
MTTYTGKNLETALQKAAQATGSSVEALKYEVLAGKTGGYALIKVIGTAQVKAAAPAPLVESLSGTPGEGGRVAASRAIGRAVTTVRRGGDRGGDRGARGGDRAGRGGDRGGDRGPRPERGGDRGDRGPRPERGDRGGDRGPRRRDEQDLPPIPADGPTAVTVEVEGELTAFGQRTQEVLVGLLERMGFGAKVKIVETADEVVADLHSGVYHDALVHKELELLDALEHLLEKSVHLPGETGDDKHNRKKIHLDSNGFRAKADVDLAHSARHMAERAIDERRVFKLGPLDPRARRVVHMTLKEMAGVVTKSEGEGVFRRVCIIPKGAENPIDEAMSVPDDGAAE